MTAADVTHVALRIGAGLLFLQHGLQKLFGLLGGTPVPLASQMGVAGILEFVGGILVVVGLWTRPVSVVLTLEMLVAFFMAHAPRGGWPVQNRGELPLLFALIFLFLAGRGAGPVSVDAALVRRRGADAALGERASRAT
jgi:putative oxidoreductase